MAPITVTAGSRLEVSLGGHGQAVVGRLLPSLGTSAPYDWGLAHQRLRLQQGPLPFPERWPRMDQKQRKTWHQQWHVSEEGLAHQRAQRNYAVRIGANGAFRAEDVPAGTYVLDAHIHEPPALGSTKFGPIVASVEQEFVVPEPAEGAVGESHDIGSVILDATPRLWVGDPAPSFTAKTLEVEEGSFSLSEFRQKYVLLAFWATWCTHCTDQTPHLKQTFERFGSREDFAIVSLSLDESLELPAEYVKEHALPWVHGWLGKWGDTPLPARYGVTGIPAIFLIDPDGNLIARNLRGEAIETAVAGALGSQIATQGVTQ